ncbi:hypothetical protein J6590_048922 [Homalodisca vitripennis]|nr:hypothetical protein J6590_048922 [Homalodisca vitripennis]
MYFSAFVQVARTVDAIRMTLGMTFPVQITEDTLFQDSRSPIPPLWTVASLLHGLSHPPSSIKYEVPKYCYTNLPSRTYETIIFRYKRHHQLVSYTFNFGSVYIFSPDNITQHTSARSAGCATCLDVAIVVLVPEVISTVQY